MVVLVEVTVLLSCCSSVVADGLSVVMLVPGVVLLAKVELHGFTVLLFGVIIVIVTVVVEGITRVAFTGR